MNIDIYIIKSFVDFRFFIDKEYIQILFIIRKRYINCKLSFTMMDKDVIKVMKSLFPITLKLIGLTIIKDKKV